MALEERIKNELASTYKVPEARCEAYSHIYNEKILPLVQEKFLAHLVSVTEDLIVQKNRELYSITSQFRVFLRRGNPKNGKATMRTWRFGAVIYYNPQNDYHDLRIFIAHELGHLLCGYQVLEGENTQNNANLFAFFAINGKNIFYKDKAPILVYKGEELEIISKIQAACPVLKENQA